MAGKGSGQVGPGAAPGGKGRGEPGRGRADGGKPGPAGPVWPILRRLLRYMRPHALILTGVVLAALATTAVELAPPAIIRLAVDRFILEERVREIWWAAGGLLALYVFCSDAFHALLRGQPDWATLRPGSFNWPLFAVALALMAWSSLTATWPQKGTKR